MSRRYKWRLAAELRTDLPEIRGFPSCWLPYLLILLLPIRVGLVVCSIGGRQTDIAGDDSGLKTYLLDHFLLALTLSEACPSKNRI